jgi:hypothetical protein
LKLFVLVIDTLPSIQLKTGANSLPLGQYDECLIIESPKQIDKPIIKGQYCALGYANIWPQKASYTPGEPFDETLLNIVNDYLNSSKNFENMRKNPILSQYLDSRQRLQIPPHIIETELQLNDYMISVDTQMPFGLCLPTTCKPKDIEYAINKRKSHLIRKFIKDD